MRPIAAEEIGQLNDAANLGDSAVHEFLGQVATTMSPPKNIHDYIEPILALARIEDRITFVVMENPRPAVVKDISNLVPKAVTRPGGVPGRTLNIISQLV